MSDHKKLLAWREAMSLVEAVYRDTENFPLVNALRKSLTHATA